jgi:hypothetical protein
MKELLAPVIEPLAPLVEIFVYAAAAVGFTVAGFFAELTSLEYLGAGNTPFAVWLSVMGAVALYAGIVALGAGEVLPRLRGRLGDA